MGSIDLSLMAYYLLKKYKKLWYWQLRGQGKEILMRSGSYYPSEEKCLTNLYRVQSAMKKAIRIFTKEP